MINNTAIAPNIKNTFTSAQQIVFIDSQVEDYQLLAAGVLPGIEVVVLKSDRNGIEQITEALSQRIDSTTIHLVSHGSPGCLYLGNTQLNLDTLNSYQSDLKTWFNSPAFRTPLIKGGWGDLLIYGCNVAAGDAGEEFINKLHSLTGAEIAASTTRIGNAAKGGDWNLDYQTSNIEYSIAFTPEAQQTYTGVLVDLLKDNFDGAATGWTVNPSGTDNATTDATGKWVIGVPTAHNRFGTTANEQLAPYSSTKDLLTGSGGNPSDVSVTGGTTGTGNGVTTVRSPSFILSDSPNFNTLAFRYYLSTDDTTSVTGTDSFKVELVKTSDNTVLSTLLNSVHAQKATNTTLTRTGNWGLASTSLDSYAGQNAYLRLTATDANNNSILEAGIDDVSVTSIDKSSLYTANEKYSLGNRIWNDSNNNGLLDGAETGINNVVVNLYKDSNNDGTPDGGILATKTTSNGGYYRFDNLLADNYIVEVAASNFNTGKPLVGLISSSVDEADPDSNVDKNDNGIGTASSLTNGIRSGTVTLGSSFIEPTGETDLEPVSFSTINVTAADGIGTPPTVYVNAIDGRTDGRYVSNASFFEAFNVDVTGYGNDFTGFCIEFAEFVNPGDYTPVNATGPGPYYNSSYNDSADISNFFGVDPNAVNYGIITQAELNLISTVWSNKSSTLKTNVDDATAMQALIWELQNDQTFDLNSGNFYLDPNAGTNSTIIAKTNSIKTTVETWVNNFNTGTWTGSLPLAILTYEDNQDIIVNLDLGTGSTDSQSNLTTDFGFTDQIDYGDAPDTLAGNDTGDYTTTSANGGASHGIVNGLTIGSTIDKDNGKLQNAAASADDTTNTGAADDEDGITSFSTLKTDDNNYSVSVKVTNTVGAANLIGWIDFNQDGIFQSTEASNVVNVSTNGSIQTKTLNWSSIPANTKAGTTYARFRLSTDANLTTSYSTGAATNGEVEDYQVTIAGVDYGDAPDTGANTGVGNYQTRKADGGASHTIVSGLSIGSTIDGDSGTLQDATANLDDTTNTGAADDEDGVTKIKTDGKTYTATVNVNNTTATAANLLGWIDFNQNGVFDDTGEAASSVQTVAANSGATTQTLTWNSLPSGTNFKTGNTFARFRLNAGNLSSSNSAGALGNGEVEDYQLKIKNNVLGTGSSEIINTTTTIKTTAGDDFIVGGAGQDTLTGGSGNDCFYFNRTSDGIDIITDFDAINNSTNRDKLDFSKIVSGELNGITFSSNPFDNGYIKAVTFGTGVMIQVDVDPTDTLFNKNVALLQNTAVGNIDASDFIF